VTTLGLAWLLALVASLAVGITLYESVQLSERRRRFVSAVTHELRTPLTTFKLYSEMLAGGFVPDEKRQQYLETLKDESERLSAMVENVLTHARLEQRGGTRRLEKLTLEGLLARVTPPLHRQAEASGFTLDVQCEPPGASPVEVDAASIGQVLRNLVDNAGKYGRNGAGSTVELSVQLHNGSLIMKVRDRGPGVPAGQAKSIFDPFDRGDRDPTDPNPGIGLGLSISRGLARDMRGDVTLESSPGQGACFRLEVPAE
jgi:signal transduction histidine kinase